jgi:4-hydroxybenzoate polyprenyltransferase
VYFLKLIRPINLAIIALTMYGIRYYILKVNYFQKVDDDPIDFMLLVISTVLIAAAGNIINDYFDVKADRINKPEKLIITKHIKRRWAILTHWTFNGLAFGVAIYLSYKYDSLSFVFIHLISINTLWFYSMLFKRKALIGNIMIAGLTALVPILTIVYFKVGNSYHLQYSEFDPDSWVAIIDYSLIYALALFAFTQNLAREIVKDIQDIKGDELIYVKSLPMIIGQGKSLLIVCILLLLLPAACVVYLIENLDNLLKQNGHQLITDAIPFTLAALINLTLILLIIVNKKKRLKLYDVLIKISMLIGVLATVYIAYFHQ